MADSSLKENSLHRVTSAASVTSTTRELSKRAGVEESIKTYKLLEALRANDKGGVDEALKSYTSIPKRTSSEKARQSTSGDLATPLHLAVQCAPAPMVEYVISTKKVDLSARNRQGNTALHLAAMQGRDDVVDLLLQQPDLDDSVTNHEGKQAFEIAKTSDLSLNMQVNREKYAVETSAAVKEAINQKDYARLDRILKRDRAKALLHMNRLDIETGSTILHDAARRNDKRLVELLLAHGADPIRRDRKSKLPYEVTKDPEIRTLLRATQPAKPTNTSAVPGERISQKGYLKKWTNYARGSKLRWFVLDNTTLSYYKHPDDTESACRGSLNMKHAKLKLDHSDKQKFEIVSNSKTGTVRYHLRANHPVEANRWIFALTQAIQAATADSVSVGGDDAGPMHSRTTSTSDFRPAAGVRSTSSLDLRPKVTNLTNSSAASINTEDDSDEYAAEEGEEPHKWDFEVTAHSAQVQLEILEKLLGSLPQGEQRLRTESGVETPVIDDPVVIIKKAASSLHGTLDELVRMSQTRDAYWRAQLEREKELRRLWEENMETLAEEQEHMEEAMNNAIEQRRLTKRALRAMSIAVQQPDKGAEYIRRLSISENERPILQKPEDIAPPEALAAVISESEGEDEFFDAIGSEAATLAEEPVAPIIVVPPPAKKEITSKEQELQLSTHGYEAPIRTKFEKLDKDNRPKVSLWGILKSMVGKDMTKMTLPVSFNECTSLLQRGCEDMEYVDLLNIAATKTDSAERAAYVAAFAASEYASTVNRVAKPFNPLLHETYEYVRPDKNYRFITEQVSHHPPIAAVYADSAHWEYWGEQNVKTKFTGTAFDVNHLGMWYLRLRPLDAPEEIYTWKKVNQAVVGILKGSPVVDNYGPMEVKSHTTGDIALLNFTQRGWTSKGAYEVKGRVTDKYGRVRMSIAGFWNDKLFARKVNDGENPDQPTSAPYIIWQANPRPEAPFNLTAFAITLNALNPTLKKYLPPTDTRLRPDQRAMEEGQYDFAAEEKNRLEEKQRARRGERQRNGESVHGKPRWFKKAVDTNIIQGEEFWEFTGDYWRVREEVGQKKEKGQAAEWPDVEDIF